MDGGTSYCLRTDQNGGGGDWHTMRLFSSVDRENQIAAMRRISISRVPVLPLDLLTPRQA